MEKVILACLSKDPYSLLDEQGKKSRESTINILEQCIDLYGIHTKSIHKGSNKGKILQIKKLLVS